MKQRYRIFVLILLDIIFINLAMIFAFLLRFDGKMDLSYFLIYQSGAVGITVIKVMIFNYFGLYKSLWRYAGVNELMSIVMASAVANVSIVAYIYFAQGSMLMLQIPRSVYMITWMLDILFIGGIRYGYRVLRHLNVREIWKTSEKKSALIIGAGDAGNIVIKELKNHENLGLVPVAIVDDDLSKYGRKINGVPVLGTRYNIEGIVEKKNIDQIIIAIPSLSKKDRRDIIELCERTNAEIKILPGVYEFIGGKVAISQLRSVDIEDLLGREPIVLDVHEISGYLQESVVMVTGGGGSIGSELCRQIAGFEPERLIILDIYENNAYDIQNELKRKYPNLQMDVLIASVRDQKRLKDIFEIYKPDVVFHAAAHKHVPLMEASPMEAIKNNVFGTLNMAQAADKYGVKRFVLISTDKAVNPTNVMGATKRMCEMIIQAYDKKSKTEFAAVRFGNVLGSNGSVIPLFKKQIAAGGPVTVTHPEIIRYFMTIPEAVQLVIQAGGMAEGGEIFVLDMGEPVKIDKLARDLIRLSGLEPDVDIKIEYTGLRPGEKLYEELLMAEEGLSDTRHDKIHIAKPMDLTMDELRHKLARLDVVLKESPEQIIAELKRVVPTYKSAEILIKQAAVVESEGKTDREDTIIPMQAIS